MNMFSTFIEAISDIYIHDDWWLKCALNTLREAIPLYLLGTCCDCETYIPLPCVTIHAIDIRITLLIIITVYGVLFIV